MKTFDSKMLQNLADRWNLRHRVGTPVTYFPNGCSDSGVETVTCSEAWVIGSYAVLVVVDYTKGGVSLTQVTPRGDQTQILKEAIRRNLTSCCSELLSWRKTGLLENGVFRALAGDLDFGMVESLVVTEALSAISRGDENPAH